MDQSEQWICNAVNSLQDGSIPDSDVLERLLYRLTGAEERVLFDRACEIRDQRYGRRIFIRGLIEFTNFCRNDCFYCGIRKSNSRAVRYRLTPEQILASAAYGERLGFRTFVLQGGEDPWWTDERLSETIGVLKDRFPECAVTLSIGERSPESYRHLREAGADRFLLRHESADPVHYASLHPEQMKLSNRIHCLESLKELGYQTGCGLMTGTPAQGTGQIRQDLELMKRLQPEMVGIGPYLPHAQTPMHDCLPGDPAVTLRLLALVRLLLPDVLLPATTALSTADEHGIEQGLGAGCNVVMINITPEELRKNYMLYDGKQTDTAENGLSRLHQAADTAGMQVVRDRGDCRQMDSTGK